MFFFGSSIFSISHRLKCSVPKKSTSQTAGGIPRSKHIFIRKKGGHPFLNITVQEWWVGTRFHRWRYELIVREYSVDSVVIVKLWWLRHTAVLLKNSCCSFRLLVWSFSQVKSNVFNFCKFSIYEKELACYRTLSGKFRAFYYHYQTGCVGNLSDWFGYLMDFPTIFGFINSICVTLKDTSNC